jgi:hypothetical protein
MTGILKFNLPDENTEFRNAVDANKLHTIIEDVDNYIRNQLKYNDLTKEQVDTYTDVRDYLHNLLDDHNINLYE